MLVTIDNSPDGMGPDDGWVVGERLRREIGESDESFHDRLCALARERGVPIAFVGGEVEPGLPEGYVPMVTVIDPDEDDDRGLPH